MIIILMVLANNFKSYFKLHLGIISLAVNWFSEMFLEVNLKAALLQSI